MLETTKISNPSLCIYTITEPPSIINVHALNVLHASYPRFRFSPPVDAAEDGDGQGEDEHEDAHADGDHLVQVHLRASVVADEEAAVAAVRRRAAAEGHGEARECIPEGDTNRHAHADMMQRYYKDIRGPSCGLVYAGVCVAYMQAGLSVSWGKMHWPSFLQKSACSSPQGL